MEKKCENCKYWKEFGKADFENGTARAGQCQRHPPKFIYAGNRSIKVMLKYRFPISAFDDGCGEYDERKPKLTKADGEKMKEIM